MPGEPLSYADYLKAAFRYRPRVGWLGHMPVNGMALFVFAMLGVVNPGFWFVGAAAEIGYLGFLSSNPSFQKLVQGQRLLQRQEGFDEQVQRAVAALSADSRARYTSLLAQCGMILGITEKSDQDSLGTLKDIRAGGLNQLLWLFLRLLTSREMIVANLSQVDRKALEADVAKLQARIAQTPADGALARSLQGTLDIESKRLDNLTKAKSSLEVIDAELDRIEQQARLIREESAVSGGPELLSSRLDAVTSALGETSKWMDQHAELFGSLAADEPDTTAGALPRLPEAPPAAAPPPPPGRARQKA